MISSLKSGTLGKKKNTARSTSRVSEAQVDSKLGWTIIERNRSPKMVMEALVTS